MLKERQDMNLLSGDRIVVPKKGMNLIQHHAIYLGFKEGVESVAENTLEKGVQILSISDFFRDVDVITKIERFEGNHEQRLKSVKKAISLVGKKYDVLNFNCEHYANFVQDKNPISKQVHVGGALILLFLATKFYNN